jgi:glucose/arabinose dehydrogenase
MKKLKLLLIVILSLFLIWPEAAAADGPLQLDLIPFVTSGLDDPIGLANAGPGDNRLFVVERDGRIKIIQPNGTVLATPFLDINGRVFSLADDDSNSNPGSEQGLLGLAFHPDYADNGYFYVNYIFEVDNDDWLSRFSRFEVRDDNPNLADPNSEQILLTIGRKARNHNAGALHFGPDGYLYIPMGDGGGSGDDSGAGNNAQTRSRLLGKIIRIDVNLGSGDTPNPDCQGQGTGAYKIPPSNPFIGAANTCDEIWAIGLRNPWRSSFDRQTGDFYIGDVGQGTWEEVDFQAHDSTGGLNYGWRCYEGNHPFNTSGCQPINNYTFPIFEYNQTGNGCTVIGGYVYRGSSYPAMFGRYLLADYCTGNFWDLERQGNTWQSTKYTHLANFGYVAFGEDADGELYVVNLDEDRVYRLIETSVLTKTFLPLILKRP